MLSIGNKKYRNLQEQVGFNTEQIEKIFDVLDGLAVTDNVVAIADLSDNLNENQLEIVQKSVAFLVYDGQIYIKKSEDASKAYFDIVFTISVSGGVISFNSKEIEVDLATGALSQTTSTNSTYSSTQIDSLLSAKADITYVDAQLALKANLAGADFIGPITSPSIIENMSGYSVVLGASFTSTYVGVVKTGNKVTFAICGELTTEDSLPGSGFYDLAVFTIPATVGAKIIADANNVAAYNPQLIINTNIYTDPTRAIFQFYKSTNFSFVARLINTNLATNKTYKFRYEQTFLLSDSLA